MGGTLSSPRAKATSVAAALALALYVRHTAWGLRAHHAMLSLQQDRLPRSQHVRAVLRYTLWHQFFSATQYLLCVLKPSMGLRILTALAYKPRDALRDVAYGPHARQVLDLYGVGGQKKPVVLFIHGGTWSQGNKWMYGTLGEGLAAEGALVAVINYRKFPLGSTLDMAEDVEMAVLWIIDHCRGFGGDEQRVFVIGHSADAKTDKYEIASKVAGFVGLAGPYHIGDHKQFERNRVLGPMKGIHEITATTPTMLGERNFDRLSPTALIEDAARQGVNLTLPPFLLLHGVNELVVPTSSSKRLAAALRQAGQQVEYAEIPGCSHYDIVFAVMGESVDCRTQVLHRIRRIVFA